MSKALIVIKGILCIFLILIIGGCSNAEVEIPTLTELAQEGIASTPLSGIDKASNGIAYLDRALKTFIIVKGDWKYERELEYVEFYESEDSMNVIKLSRDKMFLSKEETLSNWYESTMKYGHFEFVSKQESLIGKYKGWRYDFKYTNSEMDAALRYYIWFVEEDVYLLAAVTEKAFSDEYIDTLETIVKSFMTYEEYQEQATLLQIG